MIKLKKLIFESSMDRNLTKVLNVCIRFFKTIYTNNISIGAMSKLSIGELSKFAKYIQRYDHKAPHSYGPITHEDITGTRIYILQNGQELTDIVQIVIQDLGDYWYFYNTDSPEKNISMYDLLYTIFDGQHKNYIKDMVL